MRRKIRLFEFAKNDKRIRVYESTHHRYDYETTYMFYVTNWRDKYVLTYVSHSEKKLNNDELIARYDYCVNAFKNC